MRISKIYVKLNKSDFCGNVRTKMSENQRLVCVCTLVHCHCSSACKHAIRDVLCIIEIKVRAAGMSVWPRVSLFHSDWCMFVWPDSVLDVLWYIN